MKLCFLVALYIYGYSLSVFVVDTSIILKEKNASNENEL